MEDMIVLQIHNMVCYRSGYMVFHMIIRKDRTPVTIMKHDVRQFKSLEGYLESGPQFVLQSYILLRGMLQKSLGIFKTSKIKKYKNKN